jgi:hypothetical protein
VVANTEHPFFLPIERFDVQDPKVFEHDDGCKRIQPNPGGYAWIAYPECPLDHGEAERFNDWRKFYS